MLFIATANEVSGIPKPLLDRMEPVSYTHLDVYKRQTVEGMKYFYNAKNTKNAGKLNIFMASEPDHIDPALNSTVAGGCLAVRCV